jgi:hypothetical protein
LTIRIASSQTFYQRLPSFIQEPSHVVSEANHLTLNDFNKILLSAVDEGLCLLGDSSKKAILLHLETSFRLKKESIPFNLTEIKKALEDIFGPGAAYLEKIIVKRLYEKLGLDFEGGTDFLEHVYIAESLAMPKEEMT